MLSSNSKFSPFEALYYNINWYLAATNNIYLFLSQELIIMKFRLFIFLFISAISFTNAQSINDQVETLIDEGGNYQDYKVIKKAKILELQQNISDSVNLFNVRLAQVNSDLKKSKVNLEKSQSELQKSLVDLETAISRENTIQFVGINFNKNFFKAIIWAKFSFVLLLILFGFTRLRIGLRQVKESKERYEFLDQDFTEFRTKSLEREQKLRRENQDLVIKLRDKSK